MPKRSIRASLVLACFFRLAMFDRGPVLHAEEAVPIIIATDRDKSAPVDPQVAIDDVGTVHAVYGVGNRVFHCVSSDRGRTFATPKEILSVPNLSLGMRRGPRIVASAGIVAVSIIAGEQGKGRDGDLLVWHSKNGGSTWQGPSMVNRVTGSAREGLHGMAINRHGTVWCTWLDLRNKKTELFVSHSRNGGKTWSENILAYASPEKSICECCHPTISVWEEAVAVMFRNSLRGNRDMYVALSKDGSSFEPAIQLDDQPWSLNACPMDGGMMVMQGPNKFTSIWMRKSSIFRKSSSDEIETPLGKGQQAWIAPLGDETVAAWTEGKRGNLRIFKADRNVQTIQGDCSNPAIAGNHQLTNPFAVVCWESKSNGESSIHILPIE